MKLSILAGSVPAPRFWECAFDAMPRAQQLRAMAPEFNPARAGAAAVEFARQQKERMNLPAEVREHFAALELRLETLKQIAEAPPEQRLALVEQLRSTSAAPTEPAAPPRSLLEVRADQWPSLPIEVRQTLQLMEARFQALKALAQLPPGERLEAVRTIQQQTAADLGGAASAESGEGASAPPPAASGPSASPSHNPSSTSTNSTP